MKLRLVKIRMQPLFMLDDGENLTEQLGEPFDVAASAVEGFADRWAVDFAALRARVEAEGSDS